jgi:hypothetical protein
VKVYKIQSGDITSVRKAFNNKPKIGKYLRITQNGKFTRLDNDIDDFLVIGRERSFKFRWWKPWQWFDYQYIIRYLPKIK